jgi:GTPase Era involved in 16S rRNA processing
VPYACSVVCTGYVERPPPQKDLVEVEIMVTRDAHKGILIGRGGTSMKALTSAARAEVCTPGCPGSVAWVWWVRAHGSGPTLDERIRATPHMGSLSLPCAVVWMVD